MAGGLVSYTRGAGMVICLERGADLHTAQLMPLPLTVSCVSKIEIDITFLVPAHPEVPEKGPLNGCVSDMEVGHWVTGSMGHLGHLSRPGHRVIILTRCETRVFPVFEKCPKMQNVHLKC